MFPETNRDLDVSVLPAVPEGIPFEELPVLFGGVFDGERVWLESSDTRLLEYPELLRTIRIGSMIPVDLTHPILSEPRTM